MTKDMQDLPWNVAGIGPEAREAARASARREGLSVGEWLTRRILRELAENSPAADRWWAEAPRTHERGTSTAEPQRAAAKAPFSLQDTADMLARISRSEDETQNSARRIEEHLKTLARRLEQTERCQTESTKTVSQATTEMNIAVRENAQALDALGAHVSNLGDRMSQLEQGAATEGFRDAIKALHQGLARLADQISETASHSATQATGLAAGIEAVAGKLAESREDAQQSRLVLEDRIAMLAANVSSLAGKLLETRDENERQSHALDARLGATEQAVEKLDAERAGQAALVARVATAEHAIDELEAGRTGQALLDARVAITERAIEKLEAAQGANAVLQPEIRRQSEALNELSETAETLGVRLSASDSKLAASIARVDAAAGGRLLALEQKLSDVIDRLDAHDKHDSGPVEDDVRNMGLRLDGLETRLRTAIAELETLARKAAPKEDAARTETPPSQEPAVKPPLQFDLPPFPDFHNAEPQVANNQPPQQPANDSRPAAKAQDFTVAESTATNSFAGTRGDTAAGMESFLAAARRNAQTAVDAEQDQRRSVFSWGEPAAESGGKMRLVLLAGLGGLIVVALVGGILLSRTFIASPPPPDQIKPQAAQTASSTPAAPPPQANQSAQALRATNPATPPDVAQSAPAPVLPTVPKNHVTHTRSAAASSRLTPPSQPAQHAPAQIQPTAAAPTKLAALANAGNAKAEELLGLKYLDGNGEPVNEAEGAKWLERAATQGEAVAAYRLGTLYEHGQGVPADTAKAVQWYEVAAKAGNRKAMHNLAVAYAQGTGVTKDLTTAAQWFSRAATLGLADSQFNLAVLYERGMGVPQSLNDAYKWYAIAASQGDVESKTRLEALASQISADDKSNADKAAAAFHPDPINRIANSPPDTTTVLGG